jgi:hypothetical protein
VNYTYESDQRLRAAMGNFHRRAEALESGRNTDERGRAYPDPAQQAAWFRAEIWRIAQELDRRATEDTPLPVTRLL